LLWLIGLLLICRLQQQQMQFLNISVAAALLLLINLLELLLLE
jgi:hypothetical protein